MDDMQVEILVVPDCPHTGPAVDAMRAALDECDAAGVPVRTTVIDSQDEAERRDFVGSPTFVVDDCDLFPEPDRPAAFACRLYAGPHPVPQAEDVRRALRRFLPADPG